MRDIFKEIIESFIKRRHFMIKLTKILCALDLSEHSKTVAKHTSMYARLAKAKIHVIYVAPTMTQYTGFHVAPNTIDGFVGEIVTGAENAMAEFIATHFEGLDVESEVAVGYPKEEILAAADKFGADLIIMGTHGRKGIDRLLFGSVAENVVIQSNVPVMTIRPE